jgi:glycerol-1-phosphate dehydrogenase [NAD(P)+]
MSAAEAQIGAAVARSRAVVEVALGRGSLHRAPDLLARHFGGGAVCLVADDNTWRAAGATLQGILEAAGIVVRRHILAGSPRPKPSVELGQTIAQALGTGRAVPVAVGSGVINDLVKFAAFSLGRPYMSVATAASMDGYTSAGAPLVEKGFKKTIPCAPARVLLADLDVIAAAPRAMAGWGYGDLAGKVPAGGDWIIADRLGIEPIDPLAWSMVQDGLAGWLAAPARIARGEAGAIEALFTGLTLVGLAMEVNGSSRPASGADHQIAHLWEMEGLALEAEPVSHGACVAVGCMAALGLYDWLIGQDLGRLDPARIVAGAPDMDRIAAEIRARLGPGEIAERAIAETAQKYLPPDARRARIEHIRKVWPELRETLALRLLRAPEMAARLGAAGAPFSAAAIGVSAAHLARSIAHARWLRARYTVLDLLDETGLLERAIAAVVPAIAGRTHEAPRGHEALERMKR